MRARLLAILAGLCMMTSVLSFVAASAAASEKRSLRLGYLDQPGSALCRIAAKRGHYREEGLRVELVAFPDSVKGLAALERGEVDAGAFAVGESLRAIAGGRGFRIIAGGGTPVSGQPLAELDDTLTSEIEGQAVVVLIAAGWPDNGKHTLIGLTAALIRAHRTRLLEPLSVSATPVSRPGNLLHFNPNPDYYRLERVWRALGLQSAAMPRDFLANHVYEEIYCDALDRLLDSSADDPVFKKLSSQSVCTPDCCPVKKKDQTKEE